MNKYTSFFQSKNGMQLPLSENYSFHSKYNPEHDGELFSQQFTSRINFLIVYGIAGGFHLSAIRQRYPQTKIIAIECNEESISFLITSPTVHKLHEDEKCFFTTPETVATTLINTYIPALDGPITIAELRSWTSFFKKEYCTAKKNIASALEQIASDYSVQCHFGGIWQRNILINLSIAAQLKPSRLLHFDTTKTAAIIAAGPSLDSTAQILHEKRNSYFIVSTDTAYAALLNRGITSDVVISIDGQSVSHYHFMHHFSPQTLYVFDLCANPAAVRSAHKAGSSIYFVETGHPLSVFASYHGGKSPAPVFPHLNAGTGTVTIAAADFARLCGYTRLQFFGADFSYICGKTYTSGTYLESRCYENATRINTAENIFDSLMFRTSLIDGERSEIKTTALLRSYKESLMNFLDSNSFAAQGENTYSCTAPHKQPITDASFCSSQFLEQYRLTDTGLFEKELSDLSHVQQVLTLVPLLAHLKSSVSQQNNFFSDKELLKLAYSKTLRYTEIL